MPIEYDFTQDTQDKLTIWCTDEYVDPETGETIEAAIDLDGKTVQWAYTLGGAAFGPFAFTLLDQITMKGYAEYKFLANQLPSTGRLKGQVQIIDGDGTLHSQPAEIELWIGPTKF